MTSPVTLPVTSPVKSPVTSPVRSPVNPAVAVTPAPAKSPLNPRLDVIIPLAFTCSNCPFTCMLAIPTDTWFTVKPAPTLIVPTLPKPNEPSSFCILVLASAAENILTIPD